MDENYDNPEQVKNLNETLRQSIHQNKEHYRKRVLRCIPSDLLYFLFRWLSGYWEKSKGRFPLGRSDRAENHGIEITVTSEETTRRR